jgi:hypothetical protein
LILIFLIEFTPIAVKSQTTDSTNHLPETTVGKESYATRAFRRAIAFTDRLEKRYCGCMFSSGLNSDQVNVLKYDLSVPWVCKSGPDSIAVEQMVKTLKDSVFYDIPKGVKLSGHIDYWKYDKEDKTRITKRFEFDPSDTITNKGY